MKKINRIDKGKKKRFKNIAFLGFCIMILFSIGFFIGGRVSQSRHVVVNAFSSNKKNDEIKQKKLEEKEKQKKKKKQYAMDPYKNDGKKIVFLTFDDGPSRNNTPKILDILKENDVKATFFVVGSYAESNKDILKREKNEGHAICNHTYSHDYQYIYSDVSNFVNDIKKCENTIKDILGKDYENKVIRFPGGSFGSRLQPYRQAIKEEGYYYIDWNCLNGDAERHNVPVFNLINRVKETSQEQQHIIILMHDAETKHTTVQALPEIIKYFKSQGYTFETF
ncbi:polysaccharide deacetylase family protein [Clostridium acetireducens]|nr:polysaccharide deacetylase family protein [Clostridium acetireducens]